MERKSEQGQKPSHSSGAGAVPFPLNLLISTERQRGEEEGGRKGQKGKDRAKLREKATCREKEEEGRGVKLTESGGGQSEMIEMKKKQSSRVDAVF